MNHLLKSLSIVAVCLAACVGCKSQLLRARTKASERPAADVAESRPEPTEEMSLGQASHEQFAANPNASPWGQSPYYFGGSGGTSNSSSFSGPASSGAKRC